MQRSTHILDVNFGRRTQLGRDELRQEREQLLDGLSPTLVELVRIYLR